MSRPEHGSGSLLRSGPQEGLGGFLSPDRNGTFRVPKVRPIPAYGNAIGTVNVTSPTTERSYRLAFDLFAPSVRFASPLCSGLVRPFVAFSIGMMPLPAGARPPCGLDLRFTLATRAARQNSLVRTPELKQCRALSTGQARYFGQVRKRDWEMSSFRTGTLLAPKVRSHSSLGQRPRNVQHHVPRPRRGRITQLSVVLFFWFVVFAGWLCVSIFALAWFDCLLPFESG